MKLNWKSALGIALSVGLLFWTLRHESISDIWRVLKEADVGLMVLATILATAAFPIRALRWQVILEPLAAVPFGPVNRGVAIGAMVNNLVPARAGELARAYALSRERRDIGFVSSLASLAVDRIADAIAVIGLLAIAVAQSGIPPATRVAGMTMSQATWVAGAAAMALLAVSLVLAFWPQRVLQVFSWTMNRVAPRFTEKMLPLAESFLNGLVALRSPWRFVRIVAWAVVMWSVAGLSFWIGFKAVGIDVPFAAALLVQSLIALGVAAPSSPGFFGIFEFVGTQGLALYGVPQGLAVSWALGFHIATFIPITLIGLYVFSKMGLRLQDVGQSPGQLTAPAP